MTIGFILLSAFGFTLTVAGADGPSVIFDMDTIRHQPGTVGPQKVPIGTVELVEGKIGKACRFSFGTNNQSGFFTASVRPTPGWNQAAGLSFWVKGDGSTNWGGLELIDGSDYALRYGYCFPIYDHDGCGGAGPLCHKVLGVSHRKGFWMG